MSAYFGVWQVASDDPVPPELIALARNLVGGMLEIGVPKRELRLADGSVIRALIVNGFPKVSITQVNGTHAEESSFNDLWVPRGFVVYPAFDNAKFGVGLPIVQDNKAGPYDKSNLAPGLDRARWTDGGPCGEVLVSPDKDAGYPSHLRELVVPLLYHPTKGPTFHWTGEGSYDDRRFSGTWQSYRIELVAPVQVFGNEDVAASRTLLEQINTYRVANAVMPLNLPPRGYYQPGKVMASIMFTNGSTAASSSGYPQTYKTEAARVTKDGYSATLMGAMFSGWARGDNPTTFELRAAGGSADGVLAGWKGDTDQNAILRKDVGHAAFGDVMNRGGFWCADVISRTRWIEAGNCSWQSGDPDLPPLSWFGFASVNLAWETYQATYDVGNASTAPLVPLRTFTDANGDCWLNYTRSTAPAVADVEPGMSRHIMMRGRSIAVAPRGGLVWGASFIAYNAEDRLIALVHHPEDQPTDYKTEGFTRYLRVWWCDVPKRAHLRGDPQMTVCGEDVADPWGWKGGDLIDVGHMPAPTTGGHVGDGMASSLKYASQWKFNANGSRAVCLRDYGVYADYSLLYGVVGIQTKTGLYPRAVELTFVAYEHSTIVGTVWHDYTAGAFASNRPIGQPLDVSDAVTVPVYEHPAVPNAVDFDQNGALLYSFTAVIASFNGVADIEYSYVGIGSPLTKYPSDLLRRRLHGAALKTPSSDFRPSGVIVADVPTASFVLEGVRPRINQADGQEAGAACYPFTEAAVHGVRMVSAGQLLNEAWYPAPDGAVFSLSTVCDSAYGSSAVLVELPLANSRNVQAFHASRFGKTVFSTQVGPVPYALLFLDAPPADAGCGCRMDIQRVADASHYMAFNELNPRGGHVIADVPLPVSDWLIYAKVV